MSRYKQTSNPFEDDDTEGDFVVVEKRSTASSSSSSNSNKTQGPVLKNESVLRPSVNPSASSHDKSSLSSTQSFNRQQKPNYYSPEINSPNGSNPFENRHQRLIQEIENSENTQLESTQRALASIYDSEAMGIATAEELLRQAETLNNIETKTEGMQQNLKTSQRHLNNIKSVFGGIKNWWSSDKKAAAPAPKSEDSTNSKLKTTIEKIEKTKPDTSGFYDDEDVDARFMAGAKNPVAGQYSVITPVTRSAREEEIDQNLYLMCDGMSRLKGLALGLGDEIERQNAQLDRINVKVDSTDILLSHRNTQMRGILKK